MSNANPVAILKATETGLVQQIDRATDLVDAIGTEAIDEAVDRFREAVDGAKSRLTAATVLVRSIAGGLVDDLAAFASAIEGDVRANTLPAPEVLALPAPEPTTRPSRRRKV